MTLVEFLLARIDEDEAFADEEDTTFADTTLLPTFDSNHQWNWRTDRVRAECAAKRAIVARAQAADDAWQAFDGGDGYPEAGILARISDALDSVIRDLATPYADHPDFNQDWAVR